MEIADLVLTGIIAFDGLTKNALRLHPDEKHVTYPMGNKVTIKHIESGNQTFLTGHTNLISALCVSPCGKYIASGQINHLGFKAMVIIWEFEGRKKKSSYEIHKVRVEDLCFTCRSGFLISLGGRDDGHVVVWNVQTNEPICGAFAGSDISGNAYTIRATNIRDQCFLTGGDRILKVWRINPETRKLSGVTVKVGKVRRSINCIVIDSRDEEALCGTTSGDIIKARLNYYHNMEHMEPMQTPIMISCLAKVPKDVKKLKTGEGDLYSGGVTQLLLIQNEKLLIGTGNGTVEMTTILELPQHLKGLKLLNTPQIKTLKSQSVGSEVTSMLHWKNDYILVATAFCEIYQIKLSDFDARLIVTCHTNTIYDIAFPHNYSEIFATASKNDIRLWRLETQTELLRITIPNFVCCSLCFTYDGKLLISAWNDGVIRAFTPQTGRLKFAILSAHIKAVSAVSITTNGKKLISGGCDGQVRIWELTTSMQKLVSILKEHRGQVTSLHISQDSTEVISSSTDGTCIVWDIERGSRKQVLMGNTMYMAARFSPNGVQIVTCGTDRKITYWENLDGSIIREIEGSGAGSLNCLEISSDGRYFVTGSNDCIVKVWNYHTGETTHIGMGHAAIITACKFSPDSKHIVTVSGDGSVMIWKCPFDTMDSQSSARTSSSRSRSTCSIREEEFLKQQVQLKDESVENFSARSDEGSVKAFYDGEVEKPLCKCDLVQPFEKCCCECIQTSNNSTKSHQSVKSKASVKSESSKKSS